MFRQQIQHHKPASTLHVISVISNPVRYESRYRLYREFAERMRGHTINHVTVELAFGARNFEVTEPGNRNHVQVRGSDEVWHKENLINIGLQHLPSDWEYVAWVDADIQFLSPVWVNETLNALQHFKIVQLFEDCVDTGPDGQVVQLHKSFCSQWAQGRPRQITNGYGYEAGSVFWHPGYAWAARREAIESLGGLIDFGILGAGDHHMALALIGEAESSIPGGIHSNYRQSVMAWQDRAEKHIRRDIGFVPGSILHHWHGKKKDRKYIERWDILTKHEYDPCSDIKRNWQGVIHLQPHKNDLRDDLRRYFRQRNEDSIDLE